MINYEKLEKFLNDNGFSIKSTSVPNGTTCLGFFYKDTLVKLSNMDDISGVSGIGGIEAVKKRFFDQINNSTIEARFKIESIPSFDGKNACYTYYGDGKYSISLHIPDFTEKEEVRRTVDIPLDELLSSIFDIRNSILTIGLSKNIDEKSYYKGMNDIYTHILQWIAETVHKNMENRIK